MKQGLTERKQKATSARAAVLSKPLNAGGRKKFLFEKYRTKH
jgi:hypothetical protein